MRRTKTGDGGLEAHPGVAIFGLETSRRPAMLLGMEGRREELGGTVSGDGALCRGRFGEVWIEGRTIWRFRVRPSGNIQRSRGMAGAWPS